MAVVFGRRKSGAAYTAESGKVPTCCGALSRPLLFAKFGDQPPDDQLKAVRDKALAAVTKVIQISPSERESMRNLWDPARASDDEDDLVVFYDDPDLKKLFESAP
jgi:hypothetical protein